MMGLLSFVAGGALFVPVLFVCWTMLREASQHHDFILSIGSISFDGWKMWVLMGGVSAIGIGLITFGCHLLVSRGKRMTDKPVVLE